METREFVVPGPVDLYNNYGAYIQGYLDPPVSGDYTFWLYADDRGEVWLSTDTTLENAKRIAWTDSPTGIKDWDKSPTQKSKPVCLKAGKIEKV